VFAADSAPTAVITKRAVTRSPVSVSTVQAAASSSNVAAVTRVSNRMSFARS